MWVSNVLLVVLYEQDDKQVPGHLLCFQPICTQDTLMLGTDYYLTESGIASLLAEGKVPIGNASLTRTLMEFQRIFELKGLKKADQQSILDDFNKHGPGFTEPSVSGAMPQVVPTHLHCRWTNKLSSGLSSRGLNQAHRRLLQELESSIS
ncbi:unnamed protein product [Brassica oleracea]